MALGATALTLDETLKEVFGKIPEDQDSEHYSIRLIAFQLRNAFAHSPWRPKWRVYQKYQKVYTVVLDDGSNYIFDATNLDGDGIKPEQVGGLEFWIKILGHCERLVSSYRGPQMSNCTQK